MIAAEARTMKWVLPWMFVLFVPSAIVLALSASASTTPTRRVEHMSSPVTTLAIDGPRVVYSTDGNGVREDPRPGCKESRLRANPATRCASAPMPHCTSTETIRGRGENHENATHSSDVCGGLCPVRPRTSDIHREPEWSQRSELHAWRAVSQRTDRVRTRARSSTRRPTTHISPRPGRLTGNGSHSPLARPAKAFG
jgi:hypothetical protein